MVCDRKLKVHGLNLCVSKAEWDVEPRAAAMDFSGRVAWML
jgi:hypothetical protein